MKTVAIDLKSRCVYAVINVFNDKHYIGSTNNFKQRRKEHISFLNRKLHNSKSLQKDWDKAGRHAFQFKILEFVKDEKEIFNREQAWIDSIKPSYNTCPLAGKSKGKKMSFEAREKIRKANLGLKHPEWRNEIKSKAQGGKNHWAYGKKMKESTKRKKSETMRKKYRNGYKHPRAKRVMQFTLNGDFISEYESVADAARKK